MTNTSLLRYFWLRNSFLTIDLKNNCAISAIFEMAALNLQNGVNNFDICASVVLIICVHNNFIVGGEISKFSLVAALVTLGNF